MDTETKDLTFVFDDLFFSDRQLELFNGLDSHKLAWFLIDAFIDDGKVACTYFLFDCVLVENWHSLSD